jgi:hypothetical protein
LGTERNSVLFFCYFYFLGWLEVPFKIRKVSFESKQDGNAIMSQKRHLQVTGAIQPFQAIGPPEKSHGDGYGVHEGDEIERTYHFEGGLEVIGLSMEEARVDRMVRLIWKGVAGLARRAPNLLTLSSLSLVLADACFLIASLS